METRLGMDHSFDMVSQKGRLYLKNHHAVYGVGLSVMLVDGALYKSDSRRFGARPGGCSSRLTRHDSSRAHSIRISRLSGTAAGSSSGGNRAGTSPEKRRRRIARVTKDRISFIVIDAGHGGRDPGAVGKGGVREKDITLKVAKLVEKKIRSRFPSLRISSPGATIGSLSSREGPP